MHLLDHTLATLVGRLEARGLPLEVLSVSTVAGEALTVVVARGAPGAQLQRHASELGLPALQGQLALPLGVGLG